MGYMRHHSIVVTSWNDELLAKAHKKATKLGLVVSPIVDSQINFYRSFFAAPDGSKEGWRESDAGDVRRQKFVHWLNKKAYPDGSTPLDWAEVQYGDDNGVNRVVRSDADLSNAYWAKQEEGAKWFRPGL